LITGGRESVLKSTELEVEPANCPVGSVFEPILEVAGFEDDVLLEQSPAEHAQNAGGQQRHDQERDQKVTRPP
jgi:hypothetical protein